MNKITHEHINALADASTQEDKKMGQKTTVLCSTLPNGFEIVTSSSCVDPDNYDHEVGLMQCQSRFEDKLWELEGYLLQQKTFLMAKLEQQREEGRKLLDKRRQQGEEAQPE